MKITLQNLGLFTLIISFVFSSPAIIGNELGNPQLAEGKEKDIPSVGIETNNDPGQDKTKHLLETKDEEDTVLEDKDVPVNEEDVRPEDIKLPDGLNVDTFDKETSKQLSFVEFYSPYCSHCKTLAPTWEATYKDFYSEMKKLNIQMRQVNCVESGDLCEREDIFSYPSLRIYSPVRDRETNELITGKSKFVSSFPRSLTRTVENFKKFLKNSVAEYDTGSVDLPSASILLNVDEMLKIVAGEIEQAYFVTFFPATDKQWVETDTTGKNNFVKTCLDCLETKQIWDKLSNQILSSAKTGHFNCFTNPSLCESLKLKELTDPSQYAEPKFVMFLPKHTGLIRVDYTDVVSLEKMKKFANRLFENYQYETVSARGLTEVMDFRKRLPFGPLNSYYPLNNKISVVFYYDEETVTDEDKAILPYLLEYVTRSPFNMYLYTAKHKQIEKNVNEQAENLVEYISYNGNEPPKEFNKAMHLATILTSKPTILVFRDNTLFTSIYQNFAIDMRDSKKIEKFILKNQYPLYQELTPELLPYYFNNEEQKSDKIVVTFIDSNDAQTTNKAFYNMSLAAHEYHYLKKEYYFNDLMQRREAKKEKVEKLKQQNADSMRIIQEMRKEIPHFFDSDEVLFTFIDIANVENFDKIRDWKFDNKKYKPGDLIVISKDNRYYWDRTIDGDILVNDPYLLKPVLLSLLDPKLVPSSKLFKKLVGSPYNDTLRFMDGIHERGFLGYIGLIGIFYSLRVLYSKFFKRRKFSPSRLNSNLGIIGNIPKKD